MRLKDIQGDLFELARQEKGRRKVEITLFKSAGPAIEDLAAAMLVWRRLKKPRRWRVTARNSGERRVAAMPLLVKICGLRTPEALDAALDAGADMVGFVFFPPSPRHLG